MPTVKEQLRSDLKTAMKAGDSQAVGTIRMALTAVTKAEVSGKESHELSDAELIQVLSSEVRKRREAAAAFIEAERPELAETEDVEAEILSRYLPQPLSDTELADLISQAVQRAQDQGLAGGRAMGAVMKDLKGPTAGRVDGAQLAQQVKSALGMG